jgi:hypothetical protein
MLLFVIRKTKVTTAIYLPWKEVTEIAIQVPSLLDSAIYNKQGDLPMLQVYPFRVKTPAAV